MSDLELIFTMLGERVTTEISQNLLVISDAVALDECDEVARRIARERRTAEMRVTRKKRFGARVDVSEVAAPAPRNPYFLAEFFGVIEEQDAAAALTRDRRAHHAGRTGPQYYDIEIHAAPDR